MGDRGGESSNRGELLAQDLEKLASDPVNTLFVMQQRLQFRLAEGLGFRGSVAEQEELATRNREAVKRLGEVVVFFSRYGTQNPEGLGMWLDNPNMDLWQEDEMQKPLDVIWGDINNTYPTRKGIYRVISASRRQGIINPLDGAQKAAMNRLLKRR